jgi:hypothetical protein
LKANEKNRKKEEEGMDVRKEKGEWKSRKRR